MTSNRKFTRREALASGGTIAIGVVAIGSWPSRAAAAFGSDALSPGRSETYAAAVDVLTAVDPHVTPDRVDAVAASFKSTYGSLARDARAVVDGVLDLLDGPDSVPLARRGGRDRRISYLRDAVGGFGGRPENSVLAARIAASLDFLASPFYAAESQSRLGSAAYLTAGG